MLVELNCRIFLPCAIFNLPDRAEFNYVNILHKCHCSLFTRHPGKQAAGLVYVKLYYVFKLS